MFNVVPQWNPLRLAEDFATLHNLSGGRAILGVGRGTVPREVLHLNEKGVSIGSYDNPDKAADDHLNREVFEESMEIVRLALDQRVVLLQRQALPDPGAWHPRPWRRRCSRSRSCRARCTRTRSGRRSPARRRSSTCRSSATARCSGTSTTPSSSGSGTPMASAMPPPTAASSSPRTRSGCSWSSVRVEDTHEKARRDGDARATTSSGSSSARTAGAAGTWAPTASRRQPGLIPTLDESIEQKTILARHRRRGRRGCAFYRDLLGVEHLTIFPHLLGDPYKKADEQMARFVEEVVPLL